VVLLSRVEPQTQVTPVPAQQIPQGGYMTKTNDEQPWSLRILYEIIYKLTYVIALKSCIEYSRFALIVNE
jgi:hypothetical protein